MSPFASFLRKLEAREPVSVVAIGGSMMAGTNCDIKSPIQGRPCTYTARFARWLEREYGYEDGVRYENRAVGGTTTAGALPSLPHLISIADADRGLSLLPDVVFIDFSVNDRAEAQDWIDQHQAAPPATRHSASGGPTEARNATAEVRAATEAMLRYLLRDAPAVAVVLVEAACPIEWSGRAHAAIADDYGVPFVAHGGFARDSGHRGSGGHC